MNKELLLGYMLQDVERRVQLRNEAASQHPDSDGITVDERPPDVSVLNDRLLELYSRRRKVCVYPPAALPDNLDDAISVLRRLYRDDVSRVSLVLHHHFPDDFLFFRPSKLDSELCQGFEYLSEIATEFDLPFSHIRRNGFDDYLVLNAALLEVGKKWWPEAHYLQYRMECFLYDNLATLFLHTSDYNRYWVNATDRDPEERDELVGWSGRKDMRVGDIVFMYCTAPKKAITHVYVVEQNPQFDPGGAWDGFWVVIRRLGKIPKITFADMKKDPELAAWSVIRRSFQGVVTEPVPHACYNRLVDLLPAAICRKFSLHPEQTSGLPETGKFTSEEEFEDQVIVPLLKGWGWVFQRQHACKCYFGTQRITGYVDFLVNDRAGLITLFENKLKIVNDRQLTDAVNQGKSYALMLGLPSFIVASPEGMRLYSLDRAAEELVEELPPGAAKATEEEFRRRILSLRS